jgi:hypothetical protein
MGKCLPMMYASSEGQTIQSGRRKSSKIHPDLRAWIITASPSSEASHGNHAASAAAFKSQCLTGRDIKQKHTNPKIRAKVLLQCIHKHVSNPHVIGVLISASSPH